MPAPGEQHVNGALKNPFEEPIPHISEFTAVEIATLQSRLNKQLGPEYISTRSGPGGGRVHYLAAEKVINLANEVFGFNGWSSSVQRSEIDFVDVSEHTGKVTLGMSVIVRVTLRDGTFHEDMGYGHIENCKGKAPAFEKARKEAVTDALKRALRNFGKVLGNCLYDKDYLSRVTKIKIAPSRWDESNLHRHPDYAPVKYDASVEQKHPETPGRLSGKPESQPSEAEDDFGAGGLFDGVELAPEDGSGPIEQPDFHESRGVNALNQQPRPPGPQRHASMPAAAYTPQHGPRNGMPPPSGPISNANSHAPANPPQQPPERSSAQPPRINGTATSSGTSSEQALSVDTNKITTPTFFSSRAIATHTDEPLSDCAIVNLPKFNPAAESPSIKRTAGIDHSKSAAVNRAVAGQASKPEVQNEQQPPQAEPHVDQRPAQNASNAQQRPNGHSPAPGPAVTGQRPPPQSNYVNPGADPARRIGMPGGNRTQYKPPSGVKRPLPNDSSPPLADVSNATAGAAATGQGATDGKTDLNTNQAAKRTRLSAGNPS